MTCGIYLLGFNGTPKVYIGQSLNIEDRFDKHISKLKNGKHSVKMTGAFREFGYPELEILEVGNYSEAKLNELENYHIKLWNAVDDGFNSLYYAEDTPSNIGETHGNSKFSNLQIKQVFSLLIQDPNMSFRCISEITKVSVSTISKISECKVHTWLREEFKTEYIKLENLVGNRSNRTTAKNKGIIYPLLKSPEGSTYIVDSIRGFARSHGLNDGHLGAVLRGREDQHKGWKLAV